MIHVCTIHVMPRNRGATANSDPQSGAVILEMGMGPEKVVWLWVQIRKSGTGLSKGILRQDMDKEKYSKGR